MERSALASIQERAGRCFFLIMLPTNTILEWVDTVFSPTGAAGVAFDSWMDFRKRAESELALRKAGQAEQVAPEAWYGLYRNTQTELVAQRMKAMDEKDAWQGWSALQEEATSIQNEVSALVHDITYRAAFCTALTK